MKIVMSIRHLGSQTDPYLALRPKGMLSLRMRCLSVPGLTPSSSDAPHGVFQLAYISGPMVAHQALQSARA